MNFSKLVLSLSVVSLFMLASFTSQAQASDEQKKMMFEELRNNDVKPFSTIDAQSFATFIKIAIFDEDMNFRGINGATPEVIEAIGKENYGMMVEKLSAGIATEIKRDKKIAPKGIEGKE